MKITKNSPKTHPGCFSADQQIDLTQNKPRIHLSTMEIERRPDLLYVLRAKPSGCGTIAKENLGAGGKKLSSSDWQLNPSVCDDRDVVQISGLFNVDVIRILTDQEMSHEPADQFVVLLPSIEQQNFEHLSKSIK